MTPNRKPISRKGMVRVWYAFLYSLSGINHAFRHEAAFTQEVYLLVPLTIVALVLPLDGLLKVLLLASHLFVLIVELLNTAVEAVVDKASPEFHDLAKQAKDMGSAAVLLSFVVLALLWGYAISSIL